MSRIGYQYTHWRVYNIDQSCDKFNRPGIFKRNGKWIVRVENRTNSKRLRPIISYGQYKNKQKAVEVFNEYYKMVS